MLLVLWAVGVGVTAIVAPQVDGLPAWQAIAGALFLGPVFAAIVIWMAYFA